MNQKNYLIIGASGGIGKAMVKQLIEMSANNKSRGKIFATYEVLDSMTAAQSGSFVDWAGESIPW